MYQILRYVLFQEGVEKMSDSLAKKTISELAPLVREGIISPVEITKEVLERVKMYDEVINSYIEISEENALDSAKRAEKEIRDGNYKGTLHGIPLALKDILNFKDENVTYGSKIHKENVPDFDATVVAKLKEAGTLFTGKLNMHEYAYGGTNNNPHHGPCRNPWDIEKIPGGSSGGSGAAVAADLTIASLGTDTAGSIRIPASICGIIGMKPTHGLVSKYGCFPLSWSLDHIGPMTKTVEDSAILLEYIAGYDVNDPTTIDMPSKNYTKYLTGDIKGMVIGIEEDFFFNNIDHNVEKLVKKGIKQLESMGAKVELIKIPSLKYSEYAEYMTFMGESALIHKENFKLRPNDFGKDVQFSLKLANLTSAVDYLQAQQVRRMMAKDFTNAFKKVDVMISPTLPAVAPNIGDDTVMINNRKQSLTNNMIRLTSPANLVGLPAISIPCGLSEGLPVGLQIMGPAFKEEVILNAAYAYEKVTPLNGITPSIGKLLIN